MHLTDSELQAHNNIATKGLDEDQSNLAAHIDSCELCKKRLRLLVEFRQRLESDGSPDFTAIKPDWRAIESELNTKQLAASETTETKAKSISDGANQTLTLRRKEKRLSATFIGLAACLILVLAYPRLNHFFWFADQTDSIDHTLAKTISENNELQQKFSTLETAQRFQEVGYLLSKKDLQNLDKQIQLAYIEKRSKQHKMQLWEQRKEIMLAMLEHPKKRTVIII
jgi:hypothetical protein